MRRWLPEINSQVVGLKYFNVYGPREQHKDAMASVAFHLNTQVKKGENPKLFEGCDGFPMAARCATSSMWMMSAR